MSLSLSAFRRLTSLCHSSCNYKTRQRSALTSMSTASWGTLGVPPSTTSMCLEVASPASWALFWRFLQFGAPLARSILQWRRTLVSLEVCKGKSVFPCAASSTTSTCLCCSSWEHISPCSFPLSSSCISSKLERSELDRRPVAFLVTAGGCFRHGLALNGSIVFCCRGSETGQYHRHCCACWALAASFLFARRFQR